MPRRMRINAYLENCRSRICDVIRALPPSEPRTDAIQALTELDAFRHGALQKCQTCSYEEPWPEGP